MTQIMKKKLSRETVLKIELLLVLVVTVIAVTIAWFVLFNQAKASGVSLKSSTAEHIRVALVPGGEDVLELSESEAFVDINMPEFYNMDTDMMAPGVYGHFNLYITALSPVATECTIGLNHISEYIEEVMVDEATVAELDKLVAGHIQFYTTYENDIYSGVIKPGTHINVPLSYNEEKKVTIYWRWFYEYIDIPAEGRTLNGEFYFDPDNFTPGSGYSEDDYVLLYDYADTKIGLGVKKIAFRMDIDTIINGD